MAILELRSVTKTYGDFFASKEISFSVEQGEFVTLLGPSGCGKTTLLKMIGGFQTPTSGDILMNERVVNKMPPEKRETAMCFQSYALFPHLSVSHNICFGMVQQKIEPHEQKRRLAEILSQVGLVEHKDKLPSQLSGGQQQRVALARAMVTRPDIILFDEPLSNLDAKMREGVRFEIKELQRQHKLTSIYVTHDQAEALAMSDRIVVLNGGNIEQIGTPEDIYYRPVNRFVADFIGAANIHQAYVEPADQDGDYCISCNMGELQVESSEKPLSNEIFVCWRPEDAEICQQGERNSFAVQVESTAFQGNNLDVFGWVGVDSKQKIRLQLSGRVAVQPGEIVHVKIPKEGIRFLEGVTA
ncbi:ABC transporter ATP-binding protein [Vibrio sp. 10N.286.49.C2]|uniref:ABC transporter ATP-binding protein n=1 Tax=unclassified Vibrio TaxID=2614977 RepID=UPI000C857A5F|nr:MULTISPECIES: ABC transporter ATP-binding protein [unclassified Vibrio]PMH42831.1 ABC transporter ATP-binding protein [Vibrio sp. 10N.286.49.C2]PMH53830.1 ABC transporter ATP-binding protein [Vibrio sp. 10N.286.49.B1]PMH83110.1 ABC transporter ATP-binding protein [Vibrio sp. 10N.286.48.B7]